MRGGFATTRRLAGWIGLLASLGVALGLAACGDPGEVADDPPVARAGEIDLRSWDPERDGPVELAGEWRFEWLRLRDPGEAPSDPPRFVALPAPWTGEEIDGEELGATGFATYSLTVLLGARDQPFSLYLPRVRTASRLFVNGTERARMGEPGVDAQTTVPLRRDSIVAVEGAERLEIVLQVANFHNRVGGADKPLRLGSVQQQLEPMFEGALASVFFIGCFVMLGCYHLLVFVTRRRREPVVFALLCFFVAAYVLTRENEVFGALLPFLGWKDELRLEYTLFAAIVVSTAVFFNLLYPREVPRLLLSACAGGSAAFVVAAWLTPTLFATHWLLLGYQTFFIATGLVGVQRFAVVVRRRRPGSGWFLAGFAAFLAAGVADGFLMRGAPGAIRLVPVGFVVFALAQSLMLARTMAESVSRAELLSARLFALASEHQALEQEALRDPLTGLDNRRRLDRGLEGLVEPGRADGSGRPQWISLLYLDIDRFKEVNDRYGHEVGDLALRHVAQAIREEVRNADLSVRMGGDEFVVLLRATAAEADRLAERLRSRLSVPFEVDGETLRISASIGRATTSASRVDLASLLRRADRAMYERKAGTG